MLEQLKLYKEAILLVFAFALGFYCAWQWKSHTHEKEIAAIQKAQREEAEKSYQKYLNIKEINTTLEQKLLEQQSKNQEKTKEIIKYVPKIVTKEIDAGCELNRGAIRMYNASITNDLLVTQDSDLENSSVAFSTLYGTTLENNLICSDIREKYIALQEVVKEYQKQTGGVK